MPVLPYAFAKRHGVLLSLTERGLLSYWREQLSPSVLMEVQRLADQPIVDLIILSGDAFNDALAKQYEGNQDAALRMMDDIHEELDLSRIAAEMPQPEDLLESADDAPIIRLINALLTEAIKESASDIHIDAFENDLLVRFRVDGVLREALKPPRAIGSLLVSRIKVMAKLDIAEKRLPQDGRISLRIAGRSVDVRVSTLPAGHGERVVLRLLDKREGKLDLKEIGLDVTSATQLQSLITRPHGILLVTGPTGSGKTTTLYSALSLLNDRLRNIMTVEDPIEYYLDGISQTQVNTRVDMTFARGLRAILRQDPDVIMVGEIRDLETAEIAVQASLTGHLVLSTLHTNSALGAITRLRDMGVEPFLLSSSLIGVLAQRLVRVLCPQCKQAKTATAAELIQLKLDHDMPAPYLFEPVGCARCNQSGYRGRMGLFELITVDAALQQMIHEGDSEAQMTQIARQHSCSLLENGRLRVLDGSTSLAELMRVTQDV